MFFLLYYVCLVSPILCTIFINTVCPRSLVHLYLCSEYYIEIGQSLLDTFWYLNKKMAQNIYDIQYALQIFGGQQGDPRAQVHPEDQMRALQIHVPGKQIFWEKIGAEDANQKDPVALVGFNHWRGSEKFFIGSGFKKPGSGPTFT